MASDAPILPRIQRMPEFAGILREQETFAQGEGDGFEEQINSSFDLLLLQSGLDLSPSMLLMLSICSATLAAGIAFVAQENFLTTALAFGIAGAIPVILTIVARGRRQNQIMKQMPAMVDELARAAKTGRSLEQCLHLVANDAPAPLGYELRLCTGKLALGVGLVEALKELPKRTGIVSMNVLTMALTVHQQTGGDLVTVMDRLSRTIRDRINFLGRLRSATAASRASSLLMIGLPPAIMAFFAFRDPEYFNALFASSWGRNVTLMAIMLQIIGAMWVLRILQNTARS